MTSPIVWVVYSQRSGVIRRVVLPDPGERVIDHMRPGECVAAIPNTVLMPDGTPDMAKVRQAMLAVTGTEPPEPRCAVIRDGMVINVIMADPEIDHVEGCALVLDDEASIGWTWTGGRFKRPE